MRRKFRRSRTLRVAIARLKEDAGRNPILIAEMEKIAAEQERRERMVEEFFKREARE